VYLEATAKSDSELYFRAALLGRQVVDYLENNEVVIASYDELLTLRGESDEH